MGHATYGYRIENGKAVIDIETAEQIKTLFQSYLSGDSLDTAADKAGIEAYHTGIRNMLGNTRYLGDEYYPAIIDTDTFAAAEVERVRRAVKLGRVWEPKKEKEVIFPTTFRMKDMTQWFDDPFKQAEYAYSLIETEAWENGRQQEYHRNSGEKEQPQE
jgi:hypothetical protein